MQLAKWAGGLFTTATVLFGLVLGAAAVPEDQKTAWYLDLLDILTAIFVVASFVFLLAALLAAIGFVLVSGYRFFHSVEVPNGKWYCRYWPAQRKAHVSGTEVTTRESAGRVRVSAKATFAEDATVEFSSAIAGDGTYTPQFRQEDVDFPSDPKEGDMVMVTVTATPEWWRGRPATRTEQVRVGITDHRKVVTSEQVHTALRRLDEFVDEAQAILDECGRPRDQMVGAPPMYFQQECMPRINKFYSDAIKTIDELVPEFRGRFENVGNVTHNTDDKPAMIQQVERWLDNIKAIQDGLRKRLDD
ncbi:MAG: hypothetical protein IH866_05390 [Chloroflexi bacterium]|nr:hypothetical protein [Chloroflexota bacterium]